MVGYTNSQYRQKLRLITKKTLLFTEMTTSHAILRGLSTIFKFSAIKPDKHRFLNFQPCEKPVIFQIAGNDPQPLTN